MKSFSTPSQNLGRTVLGTAMLFAGIAHLTFARKAFQAQVPKFFPQDEKSKDLVVTTSGVAEIAQGAALLFLPKQKKTWGRLLAAFFVAVFPGNIAQYVHRRSAFGLDTDRKRFVRLFFQPLLIYWALWSTGNCSCKN